MSGYSIEMMEIYWWKTQNIEKKLKFIRQLFLLHIHAKAK